MRDTKNITLNAVVGEQFIKARTDLNESGLYPFDLSVTQFAQLLLETWYSEYEDRLENQFKVSPSS
jgi:hypothetical protein